jgi:hypothetical protein
MILIQFTGYTYFCKSAVSSLCGVFQIDYILTLETILFWIYEQKYLCLHFC